MGFGRLRVRQANGRDWNQKGIFPGKNANLPKSNTATFLMCYVIFVGVLLVLPRLAIGAVRMGKAGIKKPAGGRAGQGGIVQDDKMNTMPGSALQDVAVVGFLAVYVSN